MDVYEHHIRLVDLIDMYRDLLSSSLGAYLSTVSNRSKAIMKSLTIVSTIMLPLTLITGVFGMNFERMPLIGDSNGFWWVIGSMGVLGVGMFLLVRRPGWM